MPIPIIGLFPGGKAPSNKAAAFVGRTEGGSRDYCGVALIPSSRHRRRHGLPNPW